MSKYLFLVMFVGLSGCYLPPNYAYGDLFVLTPYTSDVFSLEVGACKGETLRWNVGEGRNPTLTTLPAQNVEPPLPSRIANSGELHVMM